MPQFYNLPSDEPATAYQSGQVTVGASATLVCAIEGNESGVLINNGSGAIVYLGGPAVTTSTGLPVPVSTTVLVPTYGGALVSLYAVSATSSTVSFLHPTA